jgi:uncharacterized RDD family membrane protein YckC
MTVDDTQALEDENPYAAPEAEVRDVRQTRRRLRLATRGSRLAAAILDGLFIGLALVAGFLLGALTGKDELGVLLAGVCALVAMVVQVVLLVQNRWTLGKKAVGIKIVMADGSEAGFGRILGLRIIVNGILSNIVPFYGIVDVLFIFRDDQRCIHDLLAGTTVVDA